MGEILRLKAKPLKNVKSQLLLHLQHGVAQMNCSNYSAVRKPPKTMISVHLNLHVPELLQHFQLNRLGGTVCIPLS